MNIYELGKWYVSGVEKPAVSLTNEQTCVNVCHCRSYQPADLERRSKKKSQLFLFTEQRTWKGVSPV